MDLSVEEFCAQAAGRIQGNLTFQGYPVRLNPKLSVCRQLHNRWLDATGRDVSYEEFKRSLRFSMKNGQVAVRLAYDPTKFVVAGLAVGATAAAIGGYQWWKSQKGKKEPVKCVQPDYEQWENGEPAKTHKHLDDIVEVTDTYKTSKIPIKQILLGGTEISGDSLKALENAWRTNQLSVDKTTIGKLTYSQGFIDVARYDYQPSLSRPDDWVTTTFEDSQFTDAEKTEPSRDVDKINIILRDDLSIGEQIVQAFEHGYTRVGGKLENEDDLFLVQSRITSKYTIPQDNEVLVVGFLNLSQLKNIAMQFSPSITVRNKKYVLSTVFFSDDKDLYSALLLNGNWTIYKMERTRSGKIQYKDAWAKKVPENNLSNLCAIPIAVTYAKDGVSLYDDDE